MTEEKLGLDFGDVIVDSLSYDGIKFAESSQFLRKSYTPDAVNSIIKLKRRFGKSIYIVSRVDKSLEIKILEWLNMTKFFEKTGIPSNQIFFVVKRSEKSLVCEKLGITHFVDDRLEVLGQLKTVHNRYLFHFNPKSDEDAEYKNHIHNVSVVRSWKELTKELLSDIK